MKCYLALLRGVNVSGKNLIKMEDLRRRMEAAGFSAVKTFIQSGNVVFQSAETDPGKVEAAVAQLLTDSYGYTVTVFVLGREELAAAVGGNPFSKDGEPEPSGFKKLHVTFLSETPSAASWELLCSAPIGNDRIALADKVVYFQLESRTADSKLSNALLESKLKVKATARNWNTTLKLLELMESCQTKMYVPNEEKKYVIE